MEVFRTSSSTTSQEIVYEGWLIKSPPLKFWRARWRKRWFALRHSGELPGQYFLEYFTDKQCRKLKGRIDLDQCEQVDAGLRFENRKQKYQYMFNVKTPKRVYYLVAENEGEMNKWVDAVCQVCGLKAYTQDEEQQMFQYESQESPPTSPTSTISGPYIPISECISGRRLNDTNFLSSNLEQRPEHYDAPRRLAPSPPRSPTTTDAESVFTDDEWSTPVSNATWNTLPSTGSDIRSSRSLRDNEICSWSIRKRFGKLKINSSMSPNIEKIPAPPRPPKPPRMLSESSSHNYLNLDGAIESSKPTTPATPVPPTLINTMTTGVVTDESYDFPRSHQPQALQTVESSTEVDESSKHLYSNAAPSTVNEENVFRYDFQEDESPSLHSENSVTATYVNLQFPLSRACLSTMPPPMVHRELKPGRKISDSTSILNNDQVPNPTVHEANSTECSSIKPPSINRKLKPPLNRSPVDALHLQLATPPGRGKMRAAPSPTPPTHIIPSRHLSTSDEDNNAFEEKEEIYFYQDRNTFVPASNRRLVVLQYLDLDLDKTESFNSSTLPPAQSAPSTTVYKTVDFLKTEAFNRTRQRVEEERKLCSDELA
ncbi:GRB2-associated-binding protein 2 isoform X2 [Pseudomyrmex gracilis]|uniref:GRB2-associated-binding protein 2 isoform X2 n=1 Tax=Pseudomyrmex gracilis TaxID=219809 RepID=UPI0009950D32|nr:GRB2-associated-binding protein 2 isoform X2 [Pseudomyrmex gracilis]